jgi:hypothetical protein
MSFRHQPSGSRAQTLVQALTTPTRPYRPTKSVKFEFLMSATADNLGIPLGRLPSDKLLWLAVSAGKGSNLQFGLIMECNQVLCSSGVT